MKYLPILISLSFLLLLSCSKGDYDDYETRIEYFKNIRPYEELSDITLTVSTWNIQLGFNRFKSPWSNNIGASSTHIDSIVDLLKLYDSDIIMLQEVPLNRENNIIKKVLDSIATRMNYNYAFGAHGYNSDGTYPTRAQWGNAILTKYPIISITNKEILNFNDKWTRRSVLQARIEVKTGLILDAYSLHYEASFTNPCDSLGQLKETIEFCAESTVPKIIAGDFNCDGFSMDYFFPYTPSLVYHDSIIYATNDRVYMSDHFEPLDFDMLRKESYKLSDHAMSVATIRIE